LKKGVAEAIANSEAAAISFILTGS